MNQKNVSLLVIMIFGFFSIGLSQGEYLEKGMSGFGISSGFSTISSEEAYGNSVNISFGYSISTIVDINLGYAKGHPYNAKMIIPSVSYYLSKQDVAIDETIALSILLRHLVNSNSSLDENTFGFAISLAHSIPNKESLIFQPNINIVIYPSYRQEKDKRALTMLTLGLSIGHRFDNSFYFVLTPSVGYLDGYAAVGASLALITSLESVNN